MKLRPLHDKVIIKPKQAATKSASGLLHLSEHAKPEQVGTVLALGKNAVKSGAKVGDTVLFSWQSGQEIILNDSDQTRVLVMLDEDLLSVVGQGVEIEAEELIL